MTILLDESAPRVIQKRLTGFSIKTVQELGWSGIKNGELLRRVEERFDVLITADRRIRHQQQLAGRKLAVVVLPTNQVRVVTDLLPALEQALKTIQPGALVEIPSPSAVRKKGDVQG